MKHQRETVFKAIADPTRRKIIDLLSQSRYSVKDLTLNFAMSQPAVSQHLRELRAAKLVRSERIGVEQLYSLTADPLAEVFHWVSSYRMLFDPAGHAWAFSAAENKAGSQKTNQGGDPHGH